MKNVLVFPCGSEIGLEIYKSVNYSTHFKLYGGSSVDDHGKFVYENYIGNLPNIDDELFVKKLNKAIKENNIDYIFPAHDSVVLKLSQEHKNGKLACRVITSPYETCDVARSKIKTYELFSDVMDVPKLYESADEVKEKNFPVFLKPDVGQGSKGTQIARSHEDINFYLNKDPSLMILEYLPGSEYTVDCLTDSRGTLLFAQARERKRVSNGISVSSSVVDDEQFYEIAKKINNKVKFIGAWFYQVKENTSGKYALLEIAPRIAGTMGLSRAKGVNLPLLSLFLAEGFNVEVVKNSYNVEIDRALQNRYKHNIEYSHVYLDFDDLLIFENQVNTSVVSLLYQCINKGVKLHLITRHTDNLDVTLSRYRLNGLFDEIIWLKNKEKKSDYIKYADSIFIDDSHAERKDVVDNLGIPVFDAHNIESLLL